MATNKNKHEVPASVWDVEAPYHGSFENHFLDLPSIRATVGAVREPALVVGAGQGLIVEELRKQGLYCDGVDLSPEMIKYAKLRRGLTLVEADAQALPFETGSYATIIYATGVIDFIADEAQVGLILNEGRRVLTPSGNILVAFYRVSDALVDFLLTVGLLKNNLVSQKQVIEMYLLNFVQILGWVAKRAGVGHCRAATILLRMSLRSTIREKTMTFRMQKMLRNLDVVKALIAAAAEKQPYRNQAEIRALFERLAIPIKQLQVLQTCYIVHI
jgi:SAM-dependent methyltransferase